MVSKTREKLIEVARQLFTNKGVENTTMNDIAAASEKGRRTIYTYFKNKREIYNAVVEKQSERIIENLRSIASGNLHPAKKLEEYLYHRFRLVDEYMPRHDSGFRHIFDRDLKRMGRVHKLAISKEAEVFKAVLDEGVNAGIFDSTQAQRLLMLEPLLFQGVDFCVMRDGTLPGVPEKIKDSTIRFLVDGILNEQYKSHN